MVRWDKINSGYVLINTIPEWEHRVYNKLSKEDEIIELKPLFESDNYDMIAKIKKKSLHGLNKYVGNKIKKHNGVIKTKIYY